MWTVTLADLRMRSRQFAIAVVGATLVFAMALLMAGLAGGFRAEAARTVDGVGADAFIVRAGSGGAFSSPSELDGRLVGQLRRTAGVLRADPLVVQPSQNVFVGSRRVFVHLIGVRPGGLGTPRVDSGNALTGRGQVVVDSRANIGRGAHVTIGGRAYDVVGVTHGMSYFAGTPSIYVSVTDAQELLFGGRHDVTAVAVRGSLAHAPAGLAAVSANDTRADLLVPLRNGLRSIDILRDFLWAVAVVIIGAVVYLSALERRRDFAVLKAIGSSSRWLFGGMAMQAAFVAVVSGVLAIAAEPLLARFVPMQLDVPVSARAALPPVALVIGLVASLSGLRQVLRADPALAFGAA